MGTMAAKEEAAAANGGEERKDHQEEAAAAAKAKAKAACGGQYFRMPLHYPRYKRSDYESMPEWQLDRLLAEYGLPLLGTLPQKRDFAMGAFLWS